MASTATAGRHANPDRIFFGGAAIGLLLVTFLGFAPSYYLSYFTASPALGPLLHLHGIVFTAWMLLYAGQTWLIGTRRIGLHRQIGILAVSLAVLVFVLGVVTAIAIARAKLGTTVQRGPPVIYPLGAIVAFGALCAAGIGLRRRSSHHKRLMFLATVALVTTPLARITRMMTAGIAPPVGGIVLSDLFLAALILFDLREHRRIHPATLAGGGFLLASQLFRLTFGGTLLWRAFLHAVIG
jgi:hypothetical protein